MHAYLLGLYVPFLTSDFLPDTASSLPYDAAASYGEIACHADYDLPQRAKIDKQLLWQKLNQRP